MKKMLAALAVMVMAGVASAATTSETLPFAFSLSPGNQILNFAQFDTLGGTRILTKVQLDVGGSISGDVIATNDTAQNNDVSVTLSGAIQGSGPSSLAAVVFGLSQTSPTITLAPAGNPGDFHDYGTLVGAGSNFGSITSGLSPYIGAGTVAVTIEGTGGFAATSTGDVSLSLSNFGADGEAQLTYFYDEIPEPASIALLGLGGLAMLRRKRSA